MVTNSVNSYLKHRKEVVRSPGLEPGPDPFYGSEGQTPARWQGSIIAPRQRALAELTESVVVKKFVKGLVRERLVTC